VAATGTIRFGRFYLRRALRLLPALVLTLLVAVVLVRLLFPPPFTRVVLKEALVAGCYVTNWPTFHKVPAWFLAHTWSLSVEEQFYLLWPICCSGCCGQV